ncbi:MAG: HEAT repeat domain-containing protein [Cyanobacteria bacterium P01_H01_bin.15]
MSAHLESLIKAVEAAESAMGLVDAMDELAAANDLAALPILVSALSYNNPGAAVSAVEGLIQLGEPAVVPLLEQLDQHNYTARSWAIRALAGIGDPRALTTLLGVATADFSPSVRRAAARGLGSMKWHWFPETLLETAQLEALEALLFVAQEDEEWIVRYAAIVGLEGLYQAMPTEQSEMRSQITRKFEQLVLIEETPVVRARVCLAQKRCDQVDAQDAKQALVDGSESPLSPTDWQDILDTLYERKREERQSDVPAEGDPQHYRELAAAITAPGAKN